MKISPFSLAETVIYYSELVNDLLRERNLIDAKRMVFDDLGIIVELPDRTLHINYLYLDECEKRWRAIQ